MGKEKQSAGRHGEEFWAQESKTNIGFKLMAAQGWEQGQGLGKAGGGRTSYIRAKKKTDVLGLGAQQGEDDAWSAMTGMYNELLQRLAVEGGDHVHENGGVSKVVEPEDTSKSLQDYIVKKRLYGRFRKAKDTCGYSENDMAAIMGKKAEPTVAKPDQLGYTRGVSAIATVEKKSTDDGSGLTTTTSKVSIRDYFSKKMSEGGSRYSAAGGVGFTEEFQESHYKQLHKVADQYHGKMGLGSGRSADPWEDTYRPAFASSASSSSSSPSCSLSCSSASSSGATVSSVTTTIITETKTEIVKEEKPKKSKKKRGSSPEKIAEIPEQPKHKKSKKDKSSFSSTPSSSASATATATASSSSSLETPSSSKKSKKSKAEVPIPAPTESEKPKKSKKDKKTVEQPAVVVVAEAGETKKKSKKDKKNKSEEKEVKKCSFCSSLDVPMTCGGCQKAYYCGAACQGSHWPTHKLKCKA